MINGLDTIWHFRRLLRPSVTGWYALRLWSHKVARVMGYLLAPAAGLGLLALATVSWIARIGVAGADVALGLTAVAVAVPPHRKLPSIVSTCVYAVLGELASLVAWWSFVRGKHAAMWEPTERWRGGKVPQWQAGTSD